MVTIIQLPVGQIILGIEFLPVGRRLYLLANPLLMLMACMSLPLGWFLVVGLRILQMSLLLIMP